MPAGEYSCCLASASGQHNGQMFDPPFFQRQVVRKEDCKQGCYGRTVTLGITFIGTWTSEKFAFEPHVRT